MFCGVLGESCSDHGGRYPLVMRRGEKQASARLTMEKLTDICEMLQLYTELFARVTYFHTR